MVLQIIFRVYNRFNVVQMYDVILEKGEKKLKVHDIY